MLVKLTSSACSNHSPVPSGVRPYVLPSFGRSSYSSLGFTSSSSRTLGRSALPSAPDAPDAEACCRYRMPSATAPSATSAEELILNDVEDVRRWRPTLASCRKRRWRVVDGSRGGGKGQALVGRGKIARMARWIPDVSCTSFLPTICCRSRSQRTDGSFTMGCGTGYSDQDGGKMTSAAANSPRSRWCARCSDQSSEPQGFLRIDGLHTRVRM
jgi:hypothetical protein